MCDSLCCCVEDAKKEPRISPDVIKGDGDVSCRKRLISGNEKKIINVNVATSYELYSRDSNPNKTIFIELSKFTSSNFFLQFPTIN